jgi:hypothetical protein
MFLSAAEQRKKRERNSRMTSNDTHTSFVKFDYLVQEMKKKNTKNE